LETKITNPIASTGARDFQGLSVMCLDFDIGQTKKGRQTLPLLC
jgi:hypothetical protein